MEILTVVDADDRPIGMATREDVYKNKLTHRIVHVMLFDAEGRLAIQLRSMSVSYCPGHWSTSVGGHVQEGETYEDAAKRECEEEIGIRPPLRQAFKDMFEQDGLRRFMTIFEARADGPVHVGEEVEGVQYVTLEEIRRMVERGDKFHPQLLWILQKHYFPTESYA